MWCVFSTSRILSDCLHITLPYSSTRFRQKCEYIRITTDHLHQDGFKLRSSLINYSESVCCFSKSVRNVQRSSYLGWASRRRSLNSHARSLTLVTLIRPCAEDGKDHSTEFQIVKLTERSQKCTSFPPTEELPEAGSSDSRQEKEDRLAAVCSMGTEFPEAKKKAGQRTRRSPVSTRKILKTKAGSYSLVDMQRNNRPKKPKKLLGLTDFFQKEKSKHFKGKLAIQQQIAKAPNNCEGSSMPLADVSDTYMPKSGSTGPFTRSNTGGRVIQGDDAEHNVPQEQHLDPESNPQEVTSDSLEWINEMMHGRQRWMQQVKLRIQKCDSSYPPYHPETSVSARLRSIEAQLLTTRAALWSSRSNSQGSQGSDTQESVHTAELAELLEASEKLEFREDEIFQTRLQLHKTRAQMTALRGKLAVEIKEASDALNEKNKVLKETQQVLLKMKAVRIVWPYFASEVFLAGSYDGWISQIKMEKSSAGVFVAPLTLYPGRYELKFIVDGHWKVDPGRPIVYNDAYENNLLVIS